MVNTLHQVLSVNGNPLPPATVTIYFPDGATIRLQLDLGFNDTTLSIIPDSGRDSHGNNVHATPTALSGSGGGGENYNFLPDRGNGNHDWIKWTGMLDLWQVPHGGTTTVGDLEVCQAMGPHTVCASRVN
jgi:hypothetical protein